MGPAEAVQAHLDLRARVSIASHFQVFQLGSDGFYDAVNELIALSIGVCSPVSPEASVTNR